MNYDIVIIGSGLISYATAFSLLKKEPRLKIAIIGPNDHSGSGTAAAGAMLNSFAEVTHKTLSFAASKAKFEMAIQASKLWPHWIEELNEKLSLQNKLKINQGTFVILNARSGRLDCENYQAIVHALNLYKEPYEEVKATQIPGFHPLEDARPLKTLYIPQEGCINSLETLEALESILGFYQNVALINDTVTKIQYASGEIEGVETAHNGIVSTRQVVLAAGVYSQALIDQIPEIKDNIPRIVSGVGYSLLLKQNQDTPIQHTIRTPNRSGACGLHALPRNNSTLYIGATNNVQVNPQLVPTAGLIGFLLRCAIEQINQKLYQSQFLGWHVGNRPAPIDTFPLIGKTSLKGLWILTGTYRDGFLQSPLLGGELAAQILGMPGILNNDIFLPERPLIQTMTKEESIQEYILHYLSGYYEHGAKLPGFLPENRLIQTIKDQAEKLYKELDSDFGLSPDMMLLFLLDSKTEQRITYFKDYFSKAKYKSLTPAGNNTDPI